MRIGVDVDDVLFPWFEKAHDACLRAGVTNGVIPCTWYPYVEYGITRELWLEVMEKATLDGTLHAGDPYPGALDALARLKDAGHTIHLVTARGYFTHGDLIREQTVQWLAEHKVPHDTLTFSNDKTIVKTDIFADDSEKNINALVAAGIPCCLIEAPHNSLVDHPYRVAHISQFVDDIIEGKVAA